MADIDFDARYTVAGYRGVAFWLVGYAPDTTYDEDTGEYEDIVRDDQVVAVMVGDDRKHIVDVDDLTKLDDDDYCHSCGQVGCTHDGR